VTRLALIPRTAPLGLLAVAPGAAAPQPPRQVEPIEVHWRELPRVVMGAPGGRGSG